MQIMSGSAGVGGVRVNSRQSVPFRMSAGGTAIDLGSDETDGPSETWMSRVDAARQSRGLTTALGGTCVAIFTFLLFFLYPRFVAGEADPNLFQLTLLAILVSLFLLVLAAWFYFLFTQSLGVDAARPGKYLARADACFAVGVIVLTLAPALVLLTINLQALGFVALGLWGVYLIFFFLGIVDLVGARKGRFGSR